MTDSRLQATVAYYNLDDGPRATLRQKPCDRYEREQHGCALVPWTTPKLMSVICTARCNCNFPDCPDRPDRLRMHSYCSLCGPKFNADIAVAMWLDQFPAAKE